MIPFNRPWIPSKENQYIHHVMNSGKIGGDGYFSDLCSTWFEEQLDCDKALLTKSCTHALELTAILLDISEGDEIIVPSFTFVSTVNAFVLRGAKLVFVDIRPDTMNINEILIERAITNKTKAIVVVHYGGVSCEMDTIMNIADKYNLFVVEDAAHALMSTYKGEQLGTMGHFGCFSFHETKNIHCGEGGALIINEASFIERARHIRDKGTNRSAFFRGEIDKYTWVDIGSSYALSDLNAAYLYPQLLSAMQIKSDRLKSWETYFNELSELALIGEVILPSIPPECNHNGHIFYIKLKNQSIRNELMFYLQQHGITAAFHYIPLHSSKMGKVLGDFNGEDVYTTKESEIILRLPMYYGLNIQDIKYISKTIGRFFNIF